MDHDRPDISTDALDAFLARPILSARWLPFEEVARRLRIAFHGSSEALGVHDPKLQPHLLLLLWRWSRAAAAALGRVGEDETLEDALADAPRPNPWTERCIVKASPTQRALLRLDSTSTLGRFALVPGLPLLPPADERIEEWCQAFDTVAHDLAFHRAPHGPDALAILAQPEHAQLVSFSAQNIMELEELLVEETVRVMVRHGERPLIDHMRDRYGLTRREAQALIRLGRADALKSNRSTVEDDRAMMVAMLKDALARARETMNMADQTRLLKELARVQGLTRSEPEDIGREFLGIVRSVGARQETDHRLPSGMADALRGAQDPDDDEDEPEDAPYFLLPRETEKNAVAEFDSDQSTL
jgi:hypothetical protein